MVFNVTSMHTSTRAAPDQMFIAIFIAKKKKHVIVIIVRERQNAATYNEDKIGRLLLAKISNKIMGMSGYSSK